MSAWDRFVGLPYLDNGRTLAGVDCYGLLWLALRELRGIEIASFDGRYALPADRKALAGLIAGELEPWQNVAPGREREFDGLLMREAGAARHIGIVTAAGLVLHIERGSTSKIERYRAGNLSHRIVGFYRYREHE